MIVDSLIHARWIIPVEPDAVIHEFYSMAIHEGRIVDLLPTTEAQRLYQSAAVENLEHHVVLPGLINCHTHAAMNLLRGIADDLPLMEWLQQHIWPLEQKWMSEKFVLDGCALAIAEMLRGGTTCFNDMYFFPEMTAQQAQAYGIRAVLGMIVFDFPTIWAQNSEAYIERGLKLHDQLRYAPLCSTSFAPHAPYTVSDEPLKKIKIIADELNIPIHMHVHETRDEVEQARQKNGQRPLWRLYELGLLNPALMAVHMTQLTPDEIRLAAQAGIHIVHCPESNLKLASGFCPVADCLAAGINVTLGTDGAASNNDLDMFGEMRTAALLAKTVSGDVTAVSAHTALRMATINAAKALNMEHHIGSLSIGKAADVIAVDLSPLNTQPVYSPISTLVYSAGRDQVSDVWVAGKRQLQNRVLTSFKGSELQAKIDYWQERLST
jgi:5-methylthioadenosine/S-adenosylhomocysteine deaminase